MQDSRLIGGERHLRRRGISTCLAFGLVVFALANAAPSFAGVGLSPDGTTLSYLSGSGQANDVTVELVGPDYVLTDAGVATLADDDGAGGCSVSASQPNQASCPATTGSVSVATIRVNVGDGDDRVVILAPTRALVFGRDGADTLIGGPGPDTLDGFLGDDTIDARGGGLDNVQCGDGNDTASADREDTLGGCELVNLPPPETFLGSIPPRTNPNPVFTFSSNAPGATFQCSLDGGAFSDCSSPFTSPTPLTEGSHSFAVQAIDGSTPDPSPASGTFEVDATAPDTAIDGGPPPESDSTSASISFVSIGDAVAFECKLDGGGWRTCTPPASYSGLAVGTHVFSVRAIDDVGNVDPTEATVTFKVTSKPVGTSGPPTGLIVVRPPASFVLIGGNTIRVTRKRIATVKLNCAGTRDCAGQLVLTTAKRIKLSRKRRRYVRLGAATFFIPAPRTLTIKIPLTKRAFRIVRKRKRIKTMITVTDKDRVGRTRISTREVFLKAR